MTTALFITLIALSLYLYPKTLIHGYKRHNKRVLIVTILSISTSVIGIIYSLKQ